jgi:hypothetical protein
MNPFKNKVFEAPQFQSADLNAEREEFLQDKDFTVDDLVEWFVDMESRLPTPNDMITQLYYVYRTELITDKIGMSKPHSVNGVGGYLIEEFYTKLYKKLSPKGQAELFAYMPGNTQTDEMLLHYLENTPDRGSGSVGNYKGKKLKTSTLEWLLDNRLGSIRDWKSEWWTPQLKTKAISKEPFAITFIPEDLLTKTEIRNWLRDEGPNNKNYIHQFWKNIPESYKQDPEIFGLYANLIQGGITKVDWETKKTLKKEHYVEYLKNLSTAFDNVRERHGVWRTIPDELKQDMDIIELILNNGRTATQMFLDDGVELSNTQIEKFLKVFAASGADRARIALKLKRMGKLTPQIIEQIGLEYDSGIDYLSKEDKKELMDSDLVDHLLKHDAKGFLSKKGNWPSDIEVTFEKFALMLGELSYAKAKQRLPYGFGEDEFVKMHFYIIEKMNRNEKAFDNLERLVYDGIIDVSDDTLKIIEELGDTGSYDGWKAAQDMFLF